MSEDFTGTTHHSKTEDGDVINVKTCSERAIKKRWAELGFGIEERPLDEQQPRRDHVARSKSIDRARGIHIRQVESPKDATWTPFHSRTV